MVKQVERKSREENQRLIAYGNQVVNHRKKSFYYTCTAGPCLSMVSAFGRYVARGVIWEPMDMGKLLADGLLS